VSKQDSILIGRAEVMDLPELGCTGVPVRIDTGAKTSSIWASSVREADGVLRVTLFGEGSPFCTGQEIQFRQFTTIVVASSTGEAHKRYKVKIQIRLAGRKIRASFTLADRSTQAYPVLIGRNVLRGKFIVDVSQGTIDRDAERQRNAALQAAVETRENEENI
jgi:hypothetical protein